jgi:hypothetical protein
MLAAIGANTGVWLGNGLVDAVAATPMAKNNAFLLIGTGLLRLVTLCFWRL